MDDGAGPPLERQSIFDKNNYAVAVPRPKDDIVFFLNLFPDFRAPCEDKMGPLGDYSKWMAGLDAVIESISKRYKIRAVVSWGANVWDTLCLRLGPEWRELSVMKAVDRQAADGAPIRLPIGGQDVPYYGFAHPSFASNFRRARHLAAYDATMAKLLS